jgi:two-component system sensor kinase FixL
MGQMAAAITHELNQPLSAVGNYLSGLVRLFSGLEISENVVHAVAEAREQNTRAGEIVRRLRELAVKREANLRVERLNKIIENVLGLALVDAKLRSVNTRLILFDADPAVLVDRVQIGQVVLNLVRNAIEAMQDSPERSLTISTAYKPDSNMIQLIVADTGPGLPAHVKKRLFQPFVTTKATGMGLGLSICRDIIESHKGTLSAHPNEPNGAMFVICLPSADMDSEPL